MRVNFDRVVSSLLTVATIVCAGVLLRRDLHPRAPDSHDGPPIFLNDWRSLPLAATFGNRGGPIQLIEFTDFECPFCRRFHEAVLPSFEAAFPDSVGWSVVHYPLPMHRFSRLAARAFECAAGGGPSQRHIVDVLFSKQDSLGLKQWAGFALEAGIADTTRFVACVQGDSAIPHISAGEAAAKRLRVRGTPAIMVNGWLFPVPPPESTLIRVTRLLLANNNEIPDVVAPRR